MEVSRIGSRFYENAAQSGKKVKGKQQDGFAYELQKSYDEKYSSEDTDETCMTAADGAQASGIAEFGSMGGLRAKEVVAEGVLSKAVSACEVKNLTAEDADYVEKHLAEGYVLKAKQSDDGKTVYVEQKFDDGTVKAYSVDLDKIDEETGNLIEQAAKACVQKNGKEQQTDKDWHEALEEFAAYVKDRIKNGPPKFATGATQMSVEEWDKLVKNLDDTIDDVKKEQEMLIESFDSQNPQPYSIPVDSQEDVKKVKAYGGNPVVVPSGVAKLLKEEKEKRIKTLMEIPCASVMTLKDKFNRWYDIYAEKLPPEAQVEIRNLIEELE